MNLYSQVQAFIPIRATVELQRGCELSTWTASCQMPVCTHHLRQDWSLMFSGSWLYSAHGSIIMATLLLTPMCQTVNTSFIPRIQVFVA